MKNFFSALVLLTSACTAMQETPLHLPLDIWAKIFSHLITINSNKLKNVDEIKKVKLFSKAFYQVCDSDAVHSMVSKDSLISTLLLNTKQKREKFETELFTADEKKRLFIYETAVRYSVIPIIRKSLERGIDPNRYCTVGYNSKITALCHAAFSNDLALAVNLLANPRVDPNCATALLDKDEINQHSATHFGETPLILAAQTNHTDMIKLLLKHPMIDIEKRNSRDQNALMVALNNHHEMAANILLLEQERRRPHTWWQSTTHLFSLCNPNACTLL